MLIAVYLKGIEMKESKTNISKRERVKYATQWVGITLSLLALSMSLLTLLTGMIESVSTFLVGSSLGWLVGWVLLFAGEETGI